MSMSEGVVIFFADEQIFFCRGLTIKNLCAIIHRLTFAEHPVCGCSSMVESQPSKLVAWVRFPSPAPYAPVAQVDRATAF